MPSWPSRRTTTTRRAAGLVAHFRAIAEVGLPVILYNIPSRTGINMPPDLIAELAEIPGIRAVKQANPDLDQARAVKARTDLELYAGNDDMLLPVAQMGGAGVISVVSHLVGPALRAIVRGGARAATAPRRSASTPACGTSTRASS